MRRAVCAWWLRCVLSYLFTNLCFAGFETFSKCDTKNSITHGTPRQLKIRRKSFPRSGSAGKESVGSWVLLCILLWSSYSSRYQCVVLKIQPAKCFCCRNLWICTAQHHSRRMMSPHSLSAWNGVYQPGMIWKNMFTENKTEAAGGPGGDGMGMGVVSSLGSQGRRSMKRDVQY
jgi:hypothetical protein